jgi:hypothetical protein
MSLDGQERELPKIEGGIVHLENDGSGNEKAVRAMRRLDAKLGGDGPHAWTFDGEPITGDVAGPLLILHDELNDLEQGR